MQTVFTFIKLMPCTILLLFCFISTGHSQSQKPLTFCFENWKPYSFIDTNHQPSGLTIQLIELAAKRLDIPVSFELLPWKRCLFKVENGQADAVVDASKREAFLQGPTALTFYTNTIWVHTHDTLRDLPSLSILAGRRAGYVDGYSYDPRYLTIAGIKIDYSPDEATALRKLDAARVDYAIADYVSTKHLLKKRSLNIRDLRPFPSVSPLYLSFHKSRATEQRLFDATFKAMQEDGTVDAAYQTYIGETLTNLIRAF